MLEHRYALSSGRNQHIRLGRTQKLHRPPHPSYVEARWRSSCGHYRERRTSNSIQMPTRRYSDLAPDRRDALLQGPGQLPSALCAIAFLPREAASTLLHGVSERIDDFNHIRIQITHDPRLPYNLHTHAQLEHRLTRPPANRSCQSQAFTNPRIC